MAVILDRQTHICQRLHVCGGLAARPVGPADKMRLLLHWSRRKFVRWWIMWQRAPSELKMFGAVFWREAGRPEESQRTRTVLEKQRDSEWFGQKDIGEHDGQTLFVLVQFGLQLRKEKKMHAGKRCRRRNVISDAAEVSLSHRFTEILARPSLKSKSFPVWLEYDRTNWNHLRKEEAGSPASVTKTGSYREFGNNNSCSFD